MRTILLGCVMLAWILAPSSERTAFVEADRDATLIEDPAGALANGSGPNLFAGHTAQELGGVRRGLIRFDVASAVPPDANIEAVELTLHLAPSNPTPRTIALHRVLDDWGEGPSASAGGQGRPAEPGDVTWLHTRYDEELWARPGSQFVARGSADAEVGSEGLHVWPSTRALVRDVRIWLRAPHRNFGWVLIGDEAELQSSKSFASREHPQVSLRPRLAVTYRLPGED
jgi:hypothetical protein